MVLPHLVLVVYIRGIDLVVAGLESRCQPNLEE